MTTAPSTRILVFLAISSLIPLAYCQCKRASGDTASPPAFLCLLNVTFTRQTDCSARVTETIVFPHTTGQGEQRVIQALPRVQQVSDIRLQRDGTIISFQGPQRPPPQLRSDGTVSVILPTQRSTKPSTFVLSYKITNAVMRFTDGCGKGKPNPNNNVIRWRSGPLDKTVDLLSLVFSTSAGSTLSVVGGSGGASRKISISESNFNKDPDFSVEEHGTRTCPVDQVCFIRAMHIWEIALIIAMIGVPVVLTGTCIFVFTICEICGFRSEVAGDDAVDESEMVGFRNGQYSTCIPNHDGFGGCECKQERELFDIE